MKIDNTRHRKRLSQGVCRIAFYGLGRGVAVATVWGAIMLTNCKAPEVRQRAALPSPCDAPIVDGVSLALKSSLQTGTIYEVFEVTSSRDYAQIGLVSDSGVFLAHLVGDTVRVDRLLYTLNAAERTPGAITATESSDGSVVIFDKSKHRIVTLASRGPAKSSIELNPGTLADSYTGGGGVIAAVLSDVGSQPYATVKGELFALDENGEPALSLLKFATRARRTHAGPRGSMYRSRPLEHTPIVRWSQQLGWIVASTDTLDLTFRSPQGRVRSIGGTGARAPLNRVLRDSGVKLWVAGAGSSAEAKMRARTFAEENLFQNRALLQLIDVFIPIPDGRIALRRMGLCADYQGWNVVDSLGDSVNMLRTSPGNIPVMASTDGLIFTRAHLTGVELVRVAFPPSPRGAASEKGE